MSNKNERQKVDLRQIKSNHIIKNIFNFVLSPKFIGKIDEFLKGNKHFFFLSDKIRIKLENRINQLGNFRNWYYYLKDIYSALNEVAEKIYDDVYQNNLLDSDKELLNKRKSFVIECIIYVCLFEIVYLTEKKEIFNAKDLRVQQAKIENPKDKQEVSVKITGVSLKRTIFNIIQKAINESLNPENCDSKNSDLKSSIDTIFCELGCGMHINYEYAATAAYEVIRKHLSKKILDYDKNCEFKYDLCCLILKILWLKNNNFYLDSIEIYNNKPNELKRFDSKNFNNKILLRLGLPNIDDIDQLIYEYDFDYQALVKHLQKCDDLYRFVCGNNDFDIRTYCSIGLKKAITDALPTREQKDEFMQFLLSKDESKSKIKEQKKQEQPKQEKDKSKCQIF